MPVTPEDVQRIARLARIAEPADRLDALTGELNGILKWVELLNEVDVAGVEPMTTAVQTPLPLREDAVTDGAMREAVLKNAPRSEEGFFVAPKSVE
ncbi:Asp-tRNA(Asn)/Glu-tRNA(Gln) amidotransferase subunit GatC [Alkalicaulis satelles]|uniref:Aspartyl/glutamyl-tRNA(Asn/Gln) amidotransferase subunit C n=1 Tax=Alkalicaulis satelles TaxID=2609175 RepID=A0A5M6ZJD6_9PROT|nr:Asp-tRNA(Asn)/Glu-tRNA(Gln) amidotransferase subunit GatC [Alkalicaulis satelles]KAA5804926.1 Asp-tRNA(Asn)/Glu-tRNA(Gln) amidotransferase subunit GatC [Alkalicaulis satelles]